MTPPLRIDLLGPLVVRLDDAPVEPGPLRQQALLAVLALRANRVCTAEELFDAVWGDKPPATGLKVLPTYIYRIRRALPVDGLLERTRDGYVLRVPADVVDVGLFDAAVQAGDAQQKAGDSAGAAAKYAEALELFRGEPLSGLPGHYLATHRQRLVERRYKVLSDRIDLDLASGRHADVVPELVTAVADRPLDERLAGQLMLALYAGGRQAEALTVYTDTRDTLIDQLGVEPGPELRATHQQILRNESAAEPTRDELPYQDAAFVGRDKDLAAIVATLAPAERSAPPVVAVDGMGGAGKTALAIRAAREVAEVYPDGLLYLQLHGHTPGRQPLAPQAALDHLLTSIGVKPERIPRDLDGQAALWRSEVAGKRVLVVLDDAPNSQLIAPLLPGAPSCAVLVTSRRQLTGIDAAQRVSLDVLNSADAEKLLADIVGQERATAVPQATRELVERCGHLPLAIRIAGARLRHRPTWTVEHLNQRLQTHDGLDELSADGRGLRSTFAMSYEQLDPGQRRIFRRLGLLPGRDFDRYGAGALADVPPDEAEPLLEDLLDANLLLQPSPDRFQLHDLLRDYARQVAGAEEPADELDAAVTRLFEYYLQTTNHPIGRSAGYNYVDLTGRPPVPMPPLNSIASSRAWADAELNNLLAAIHSASAAGRDEYTWLLSLSSVRFFHVRGRIRDRDAILELGLAAARRQGRRQTQARILLVLGRYRTHQQGHRRARRYVDEAMDLLEPDSDPELRIHAVQALGLNLTAVDPLGNGVEYLLEAVRLARSHGDQEVLLRTLVLLANHWGNVLEFSAALDLYLEAIALLQATDFQGSFLASVLSGAADCYVELGQPQAGAEAARRSIELANEHGTIAVLYALGHLGQALRMLGDLDQALRMHRKAVRNAAGLEGVHALAYNRLWLAQTLLAADQAAEAQAEFEAVLQVATDQGWAVLATQSLEGLADCARRSGAFADAAAHLRQALVRLGRIAPHYGDQLRAQLVAVPT